LGKIKLFKPIVADSTPMAMNNKSLDKLINEISSNLDNCVNIVSLYDSNDWMKYYPSDEELFGLSEEESEKHYGAAEGFLDQVFDILNDEMRAGSFSEKGFDKANMFLTKHGEKLAKSGKKAHDVADALMAKFNYPVSEDADYESESGDTNAMGDTDAMSIDEVGGGFKFKVGDVVNSKVNKGNKFVILMAFPNLEAAYKYDGRSEPTFWEKAILNDEIEPVSEDVADKPWYLTWTRETVGEDLVMCDPEEFLFR
jgi:hypothetical protein